MKYEIKVRANLKMPYGDFFFFLNALASKISHERWLGINVVLQSEILRRHWNGTVPPSASTENPGRHEILPQCWINVGPASKTVAQHSSNIGSTSGSFRELTRKPGYCIALQVFGQWRFNIVESLPEASDRQGSNCKSSVWRTVSFHSSHHSQEVLLAQFSLYLHKGGLKPYSFHFFVPTVSCQYPARPDLGLDDGRSWFYVFILWYILSQAMTFKMYICIAMYFDSIIKKYFKHTSESCHSFRCLCTSF